MLEVTLDKAKLQELLKLLGTDRRLVAPVADERGTVFSEITTTTFPSESQGQVEGGEQTYARYARSVAIADSTDASGRVVLKSVSVTVTWLGMSQNTHSINLHGRVARF